MVSFSSRGIARPLTLVIVLAITAGTLGAQGLGGVVGSVNGPTSTGGPVVTRTIRGRVINALDGTAIPRALVALNNRSMLTDSQGRFEFQGVTDQQAYVTLTRPGFSQTTDSSMGFERERIPNLDATLELKMYPNVTITGMVTGRDGLPLTRVPVSLRRAVFEQDGWRWLTTRSTQTDLHGEYRFRERPGRFQVSTGYVPRSVDTGEAVLPVTVPAQSGGTLGGYFEAAAGEEKRIDLRPRSGPGYTVRVRIDGTDAPRSLQLTAQTAAGDTFQVPFTGQSSPDGGQLSLPAGSYTLTARFQTREDSLEGSARVVVTGKQSEPTTIHLTPAAVFPVELAISASAAEAQAGGASSATTVSANFQQPDLRIFNLRLHNLTSSQLPLGQDIGLRQTEAHTYEFRVPPGRYRLQAMAPGGWYVESAQMGVTNLMTSEIVVSAGSAGSPIRIVSNNSLATLNLTVRMPVETGTAFAYVVPRSPTISPIMPLSVLSIGTGAVQMTSRYPVGSYQVFAVDHRIEDDLRDPEILAKISTGIRTIDLTPASTTAITLDLAQEKKQ